MRVPTALAACSLVFSGCVDVTSTRIGPPASAFDHPRFAPDEVAVYRTEDQVPGEYREVALLHVTGSETWPTESEVYRKMLEEAGRAGANAVILQPVRELSPRERLYARTKNFDMGREGRAIAIYVLTNGVASIPVEGDAPAPSTPTNSADADTTDADTTDVDMTAPAGIHAHYRIELENGSTLQAVSIEPSGIGQIKAVLPDGTTRYLTSSKVRAVSDRAGGDWTRWVLDERRSLPRVTGLF